jgi:multiple sugar transport system ATP-binding protein
MAKLELKNLNKTYTRQVVPVKNISLSVDDGEFLTLLGPSGCGKSTTLRLIAGLEQPTRGQVFIGGRDVTQRGAGDRNIAMVFQSYALYPHMTVYENMASGLKLHKVPLPEIRQRVDEVVKLLGLQELIERKPSNLSGGQRQRVALGRALVRHPDVFLLDEPLSNLDALLREHVRAELKQLFKQQPTPVVYVTHDQTEAMTLSTRVAVLNNGSVQQLDPPHRIYTHPANQFVAGFIGSPQMNLLTIPCRHHSAWVGDARIPLPEGLTAPEQIVLGIRPENITLVPEATPSSAEVLTIKGQIYLVENLGMHNLISVRIDSHQSELLTVRALLLAEQRWDHQEVTLALPTQALHWFDLATGDRLHFQDASQAHSAPYA